MRRSKRRASPLQTLSVLAVSGLFIFIALAGLYKCFSKEPELKEEVPAVQADPDSASEPRNGDAAAASLSGERKKRFYTILIGGLDDENGGSDTNILAAVDAEGGSINAVSLPRDTLLNVTWSVKKLNNAYHHGGISSTIEQISNLLGIPVDYYITVDLRAFVELVDAIEGVDFDIPVDMDYDDPVQDLHIHFVKGPRHLTGQEALEVVRWRQNNDGSGHRPHQHPAGVPQGRGRSDPTAGQLGQDPRLGQDLPAERGDGPGALQPGLAGGAGPHHGHRQHPLPYPPRRRGGLV